MVRVVKRIRSAVADKAARAVLKETASTGTMKMRGGKEETSAKTHDSSMHHAP